MMKKAVKKIISLLLITILVFSALPITVSAAETSTDIPEYVDYQAGRYSKQFNMIFGDGSDSFANTYYKTMKNNESVISGVAIWEAAHIVTSPSYFLDSGLISKKDMYKLAIFDMLDITESSTFASNLANVLQDERLSYIVSVTKAVCDPQDIKVSELKNFEVTGEYINFLEEGAKNAKALDVAGNIQKIVDVCDNLYEAVNTIATYQTISNMKNGYAEILEAIAKDDKNPWDLREAANDCVVYTNKSFDTTLSRLINNPELFTNPTIESVLKLSVDYLWDQIKSAIPGGTVVLAAASGMRVLSNAVFKMDDTCRTYYELETDVNLENAVRRVMDNSKYDFTQNKSRDNATSYMQAVNMYKRVVLQGYDYVINMLEVKASAPATQWFDWFNHDYSECIKLIDDIGNSKETKKHLYDQFEEWVLDDYNKLYQSDYNKTINAFNNQQTLHASSVSLSQIKEIHSDDNGYIYDYIKKTCQPENSTEYKKCFFTADNKDIFTIDKLGSFVAEAPGQVTLTYDEGGALETSITITIGESSEEEPYDYLSDFEYSVDINKRVTITGYNGTRSNLIIPREIKGYSVTSIDNDAFRGCTSLTSITIPNSVTSIGFSAFFGCSNLSKIVIPDSVTDIGYDAFDDTSWYNNQPNGVIYAGQVVYKYKGEMPENTAIILNEGTKIINGYVFRDCMNLTSITIPNSVTEIGISTFENCTNLEYMTMPNSVTSIGSSAFYGCSSLTSINIPGGVTRIWSDAFEGCSSLTSITIPDSVTSIGYDAFEDCSSLTSINIPDGVTELYGSVFDHCSSLTSITIPDSVTSIGYDAFRCCSSLKNINIPNSVTSIGDSAFYGCSSLTSINIPDGVTSIGNWTFEDCSSLTSITIPDSVTSIGFRAFEGCSSLTSITIPDSVTSIDNDAFRGCTSLTSITIPNSVTSIGDGAFRCCSSLTSINIPDGVTSIGSSAFEGCSSLTSINIPDGVTSIGSSAFEGCSSLTSINIPDGVTSIGNGTFDHCSSLTSINIPDIVKSIGDGAFRCCSSLTSINIPDGVTSIGDDAFRFCSSLTSINIPDGVTSIGNDAFSYCNSLTSINIPDGVTSIGDDAFTACESLTSINIPDGVTSIGNDAFSYCYNLSDVFYSNSDTEWSNISIGSDNDYLASANIHYNTSSDDYFETSRTEADCTTDGVIEYKCPHGYTKTEKIPAYGHNFINGMCSRCEKNELECFESAHPYEDNCDKSWTINKSGAKSVSITFSSQTEVEDGYDYIEIYDGKDNLIGSYTGTALASQCITVTGDTAIIRLTSDSSNSYYGFSIDSIDYVAEPNALSVGDVNGDGEITILDATCIQKYIVQLEDFTDKQKEVADVNGDGTINIMDSTQIQKYIVQLIDTLG